MSEPQNTTPSSHHGARPVQESDLQSVRVILIIFAALVVLTIVFSLWAAFTVDRRTGSFFSPEPPGPDAQVLEQTVIEFDLFDVEAPGLRQRQRDLERLDQIGWIDRESGIAHIPIDLAMQMTADRLRGDSRPAGGQR